MTTPNEDIFFILLLPLSATIKFPKASNVKPSGREKPNVVFSGGYSKYSATSSAVRNSLITNKNWVITDAGLDSTGSGFCNLSTNSFEKLNFTIFPNPANSELNITFDNQAEKLVSYEIYSLTGQKVDKKSFESLNNKINIESLANGTYLLKLNSALNSASKIFIKK